MLSWTDVGAGFKTTVRVFPSSWAEIAVPSSVVISGRALAAPFLPVLTAPVADLAEELPAEASDLGDTARAEALAAGAGPFAFPDAEAGAVALVLFLAEAVTDFADLPLLTAG